MIHDECCVVNSHGSDQKAAKQKACEEPQTVEITWSGLLASLTSAHASSESSDINPPSGSCSSEESWSNQIKVQEASQSSPGSMILKCDHVFPIIFPRRAVQLLLRYYVTCNYRSADWNYTMVLMSAEQLFFTHISWLGFIWFDLLAQLSRGWR